MAESRIIMIQPPESQSAADGVLAPSDTDNVAHLPGAVYWAGAARVAALVLTDTFSLLLAGTAAFFAWAYPVRGQEISLYLPAAPAVILFVLAYAQAGLYPGFGLGPVETLRRYWLVTATVFLVLAALIFILKIEDLYSRVTLLMATGFSLVMVPLMRGLALRLAGRLHWWAEPVVLVGYGRRTAMARERLHGQSTEFHAVSTISFAEDNPYADQALFETLSKAVMYARAGIRVAFADLDGARAEAALDQLMLVFPRVIILRDFEELPVEGVQVRNLGGVLGLEYGNNLLRRQSRWVKRALDITMGSAGLILMLPVMVSAMVAVKVLSPGPALFWQVREGRRGRPIRVPKIRTMVLDAENRMEELFRTEPELRQEWEGAFKLKNDPRVIPLVGRAFRRFSIDELPQLWSVVAGDMSLAGPRPFPHYHLTALSPQARRLRNQVRPGITGLWQVTARGGAGVEAQQSHDIYYIRNWSPWLDLHILARTVVVVISGRGAY